MSPLRRIISIACAAALLIAGLWLFASHLMNSEIIKGAYLMMCGLMIGVGAFWLATDIRSASDS